jgi:hypothetical protein
LASFSLVLAIGNFYLVHEGYLPEGGDLPLHVFPALWLTRRYRALIGLIRRLAFVIVGGLLGMSVIVVVVQNTLPMLYC